jgi:hypothetical protein
MTWDLNIIRIACVGILLTGSSLGVAAADAVPRYNINPTCESPGRQAMRWGAHQSGRAKEVRLKRAVY